MNSEPHGGGPWREDRNPAGWRYLRARDLASVVRGASPRPAGDPRLFNGDYLPWITVADITRSSGIYLDQTESKLTRAGAEQTRIIPANTLLLANSGATLGVPKITRIEAGANDGVAAFLDLKELSREFAFFFLETQTQYLREVVAPGMGQPNLNTELIGQLIFPVPPQRVQDKIVQVAHLHVDATRYLDDLVLVKKIYKRGLMQQLLTGRKRFPEFVRSNDRQLGEFGTVPVDWSVVHISDVAEEVKTRGEVDGSVVYSCTKHDGLVPSLEYFGKQVFSRNLAGYKRLQAGDFAYATNHIEEGSIGLLRKGQPPGLVSPMYTVFRPNSRVSPEFLFALLKTESYRRVFEKRTSASVDRRGSLRWKAFSGIRLGLPSIKEQDRIASTMRFLDTELDQLAQLHALIESQKRALLSRLLSGELSVPIFA